MPTKSRISNTLHPPNDNTSVAQHGSIQWYQKENVHYNLMSARGKAAIYFLTIHTYQLTATSWNSS